MENLHTAKESLYISIGISASPAIHFSSGTLSDVSAGEETMVSGTDGFSVFLEMAFGYDLLNNVLNGMLRGKKFQLSEGLINKHVVMEKATVSGTPDGLLSTEVNFNGSFRGTIIITGKPVYHSLNQTIELENADYDLKTDSFLLKTAKWLFNNRIKKELQKYTRFELSAYYAIASKKLNNWLNREWTKGIQGRGLTDNLSLTEVRAMPDRLLIRSNCTGKLDITILASELKH